jgi:hypothetical protein
MFSRASQSPPPPGASPRRRRLESDHARIRELAAASSIFSFAVTHPQPHVGPPETYRFRYRGPSVHRVTPGYGQPRVELLGEHEVLVQLVAEYPRSAPHMRWVTPIFHPNISGNGAVCLGGWGTHWAPSLHLDKLCEMLWDMLRFANYDTRSPFNQQAAHWLRSQREFRFPLDSRELRDAPVSEPLPPAGRLVDAPQRAPREETGPPIRFGETVHHDHPAGGTPSSGGQPPRPSTPPEPPPDILFLD